MVVYIMGFKDIDSYQSAGIYYVMYEYVYKEGEVKCLWVMQQEG